MIAGRSLLACVLLVVVGGGNAWLLRAPAANAAVPTADRILKAVAETNVAASRNTALRLHLTLQLGEREGVAMGELITHPTGLARLELRGAGDLVERHLLQGSEVMASRGGEEISDYRYFLPPLFVLQADGTTTLRAALESFGVSTDIVALSDCGESDCYLLGDPRFEVPRPQMPPLPNTRAVPEPEQVASPGSGIAPVSRKDLAGGAVASEDGVLEFETVSPAEAARMRALADPSHRWARLWIDIESYEVRGIDTATGVKVRFGPLVSFDELRVPAWIRIEEEGREPAQLSVRRASRVVAPASVFSRDWLLGPVELGDDDAELEGDEEEPLDFPTD